MHILLTFTTSQIHYITQFSNMYRVNQVGSTRALWEKCTAYRSSYSNTKTYDKMVNYIHHNNKYIIILTLRSKCHECRWSVLIRSLALFSTHILHLHSNLGERGRERCFCYTIEGRTKLCWICCYGNQCSTVGRYSVTP